MWRFHNFSVGRETGTRWSCESGSMLLQPMWHCLIGICFDVAGPVICPEILWPRRGGVLRGREVGSGGCNHERWAATAAAFVEFEFQPRPRHVAENGQAGGKDGWEGSCNVPSDAVAVRSQWTYESQEQRRYYNLVFWWLWLQCKCTLNFLGCKFLDTNLMCYCYILLLSCLYGLGGYVVLSMWR